MVESSRGEDGKTFVIHAHGRVPCMGSLAWARLAYVGANDQHVRELQCEGRVGYGRAETADQVRGSLACSVHNGTVRLGLLRSQACVSVTVAMCGRRGRG